MVVLVIPMDVGEMVAGIVMPASTRLMYDVVSTSQPSDHRQFTILHNIVRLLYELYFIDSCGR